LFNLLGLKNRADADAVAIRIGQLDLSGPWLAVHLDAAGGIVDGPSIAAAFAFGAECVQIGMRMVPGLESPERANWKNAIVSAAETIPGF
jgi:enoyl-[acyl-carrier protein] reductase II